MYMHVYNCYSSGSSDITTNEHCYIDRQPNVLSVELYYAT